MDVERVHHRIERLQHGIRLEDELLQSLDLGLRGVRIGDDDINAGLFTDVQVVEAGFQIVDCESSIH